MSESENVDRVFPRVTAEDFAVLEAIRADIERIGEADLARRRQLGLDDPVQRVTMPRAEFPPPFSTALPVLDTDTAEGVRAMTHAYLAKVTHAVGDDALARVISSQVYRDGLLEMDRLECAGDLEGMKVHGRQWLPVLAKIARGEAA